jgi:hypothetical protein
MELRKITPKNKRIVEVDYGLASAYDDTIEVNRKLKDFPALKESIMKHEQRHRNGVYSIDDFKNDFMAKESNFKQSLMFSISNPECLINFFPFMYSYHFKEWTFNDSSAPPFFFLGIIFTLFFHFAFSLPWIHSILGYFGFIAALNIILLVITHRYVKSCEKKRQF